MTKEIQNRITSLIIWLFAGFGLGMVSWMVGFITFQPKKASLIGKLAGYVRV
jgi:hypothetical protein